LRIAIINERWTAGATRCARDLEKGLSERHDVRYFPEEKALTSIEQLEKLREYAPDVVHLHSFYGDLPYDFMADVAQRYPTVVTPHDPRPIGDVMLKCWDCGEYQTCFRCPMIGRLKRYTLVKHEFFLRRWRKRRVHARLPKNTTFVCVSDWMRQRMLRTELARLRIERIYNGLDLTHFTRDTSARQKLGIPTDAKVISFIAHHSGWVADERKGVHVLARALAEIVIPRFPELIVLAVGGGMIPNLANVRPIGYVKPDQVTTYYSASDIFVAPSLGDNLPYTVLEAMACSVPVVASRIGGIPEEVAHETTGKLVTPGSWQELGPALVSLLEQPELAGEMGRAGRARTSDVFELSAFVRKYEAVYADVAAKKA